MRFVPWHRHITPAHGTAAAVWTAGILVLLALGCALCLLVEWLQEWVPYAERLCQ